MKFVVLFLFVTLASARELAPLLKASPKTNDRHIIVLEKYVDVDEFASDFQVDSSAVGHRFNVIRTLRTAINAIIVDLDEEAVELVRSLQGVRYVEEETFGSVDAENWGTDRINQRDLPLDNDETMPMGVGANIFIVDTGVRITHEDFEGRASYAAKFVTGVDTDCHGHGTHCAGIAGGKKYGVAKGANIRSVKVCDCTGVCSSSALVSAMDFITGQKRDGMANVVASLSLSLNSESFGEAVSAAIAEDVVVLTSSGNDRRDACRLIPGNIPEVITVGNVEPDDSVRSSSNFGSCVDILAPGTDIISCSNSDDTSTSTKTGTSMACPHVAGAAGILMADRGVAPGDVSQVLVDEASSDKLSGLRSGTPNKLLYVRSVFGRTDN